MPESGHVRVSVAAPATTLTLSLEYGWAVNVYEVLAGGGYVEANAEFGAILRPADAGSDTITMVNATPAYLATLASQLQTALNNLAMADVCTFIEAMDEAGTPEELGDAAWELIMAVYQTVTNPGARPAEDTYSCIEVCVAAPGQPCP